MRYNTAAIQYGMEELKKLSEKVIVCFSEAIKAREKFSRVAADNVCRIEDEVDDLEEELRNKHIERLPMAVTYDASDTSGGYFSGFSQSFDVSPDNGVLYQATNVENFGNKKTIKGVSYNLNDVRVGTLPLNGTIYEAEKAKLSNVKAESAVDASNGQEVRYINETDSIVDCN